MPFLRDMDPVAALQKLDDQATERARSPPLRPRSRVMRTSSPRSFNRCARRCIARLPEELALVLLGRGRQDRRRVRRLSAAIVRSTVSAPRRAVERRPPILQPRPDQRAAPLSRRSPPEGSLELPAPPAPWRQAPGARVANFKGGSAKTTTALYLAPISRPRRLPRARARPRSVASLSAMFAFSRNSTSARRNALWRPAL